jgi:hypothetical protein
MHSEDKEGSTVEGISSEIALKDRLRAYQVLEFATS